MKKQTCQLYTEKKLLILAKKILKNINGVRLITLSGDLGSGKTTFTAYLAQALGIKQRVASPTFTLMKLYNVNNKKYKIDYLCHVDFYRANKSVFSGLNDYLASPKVLTVVEWPEKLKNLSQPRIEIKFEIADDQKRKIVVTRIDETKQPEQQLIV